MAALAENLHSAVVRFAGDSGDGIQLTGTQFTDTSAMAGIDFATFPDFPAEIRAPTGTIGGVSAFQIQLSDDRAWTPGDRVDLLVAMNPAALRSNLSSLREGGMLLLNSSSFKKKNFDKAGYTSDPREDGSLAGYQIIEVDAAGLTEAALESYDMSRATKLKHKNFFMLGLVYWLYQRDSTATLAWLQKKFKARPEVADANSAALKAGHAYGETLELVKPVRLAATHAHRPGHYRRVSGNEALSLGLLTAAERSGLELVFASYPITPASDVLHYLAARKELGVRTLQAEDEIAAIGAAIGAAYAGALAVTSTSGPGLDLKSEALGLAVSLELPLLVLDVQRGGPSTGLPTKTEQSDLLQACFGRHGEAPLPVLAASDPGDCFWTVLEAARIAVRYMTPVIVLSDSYIANGTAPWHIPQVSEIEPIEVSFASDPETYQPYARNSDGARPWAIPGTPGLEHRVGGLEKEDVTGNVSHSPANHGRMTQLRAEKIARVAANYPPHEVFGDQEGDLLVIGWGGTHGSIREAVNRLREAEAGTIGHLHLRHLFPLPNDLGEVMSRFRRVVAPELNSGQLAMLLRARFLVDVQSYAKIEGQPFQVTELVSHLRGELGKLS